MLKLKKEESLIVSELCLFVGLALFFSCNIFGKELVIGKNNFAEVDLAGHLVVVVDTHAVWNWKELPK